MHIVSLIISYLAFAVFVYLLLKAVKKCTTTPPAESPSTTAPSHSGPTPTTSHRSARYGNDQFSYWVYAPTDDTRREFSSQHS